MARDNPPKIRQRSQLERKKTQRASYDRVLIVSEGSRTEPIQVVRYAKQLFGAGDPNKRVRAKAFERVFAIFDRDEHKSYFDALKLADSLDGKLRNDAKQPVIFRAIASVPCFELWLLLHYEDIRHPLHRAEVLARLKQFIPSYVKGASGSFAITKANLGIASQRARSLAALSNAFDATEPSTDIVELVELLIALGK